MTGVNRIGHVGLAVRDLERSVRFYTDVLGMTLTEDFVYPAEEVGHGALVTAGAFVRCETTHHCLSLFALKNPPQGEVDGHPYGLHHIAFEMASPERLLELYRRIRDTGETLVAARVGGPGNQPRFYARDPDGNLLEFYWGIDQIGWEGIARGYPPIREIDLEEFDFQAFVEAREHEAKERRTAQQSREPAADGVAHLTTG